jgi:hypothetical protein
MIRGGSYTAVFSEGPPGTIDGGELIRFIGRGEPNPRRTLSWLERRTKRKKAKRLRQAKQ